VFQQKESIVSAKGVVAIATTLPSAEEQRKRVYAVLTLHFAQWLDMRHRKYK